MSCVITSSFLIFPQAVLVDINGDGYGQMKIDLLGALLNLIGLTLVYQDWQTSRISSKLFVCWAIIAVDIIIRDHLFSWAKWGFFFLLIGSITCIKTYRILCHDRPLCPFIQLVDWIILGILLQLIFLDAIPLFFLITGAGLILHGLILRSLSSYNSSRRQQFDALVAHPIPMVPWMMIGFWISTW